MSCDCEPDLIAPEGPVAVVIGLDNKARRVGVGKLIDPDGKLGLRVVHDLALGRCNAQDPGFVHCAKDVVADECVNGAHHSWEISPGCKPGLIWVHRSSADKRLDTGVFVEVAGPTDDREIGGFWFLHKEKDTTDSNF